MRVSKTPFLILSSCSSCWGDSFCCYCFEAKVVLSFLAEWQLLRLFLSRASLFPTLSWRTPPGCSGWGKKVESSAWPTLWTMRASTTSTTSCWEPWKLRALSAVWLRYVNLFMSHPWPAILGTQMDSPNWWGCWERRRNCSTGRNLGSDLGSHLGSANTSCYYFLALPPILGVEDKILLCATGVVWDE